MYQDYFRLNEMPFSIAPDPRFLFMSDRHREALAHLLYGVLGEGGIVLLTGEVGTGKTTICRSMLDQLPDNIDVAFILNPLMSVEELLQTVCEEYHIKVTAQQAGTKAFVDAIHAHLLEAHAQGRRAILIIDEAQNLSPLVLEQLRLLTNLETNTRKLLQIMLIGQPELQEMLAKPEMRQVVQRVIARYHLAQLNPEEVGAYVSHRLRVAGAIQPIFPEHLARQLHRATQGVPRLINLICDRALLGTYVQERQQVNATTLRRASREVLAATQAKRRPWAIAAGLLGLAALTASVPAVNSALTAWRESSPPALATAPSQVPPLAEPNAKGLPQDAAPHDSIAWPADVERTNSEKQAFQALFKLYDMEASAASRSGNCQLAEKYGWRCHTTRGSITDIRLLDQPVLMHLTDSEGHEYAATLTRLDKQDASLVIAGQERRVALAELANAWSGNFTLLWKAPPGFTEELAPGQRNPAVLWLRQAMTSIDGGPDNGTAVFDAGLSRRIRAFQLAEGLRPDGYVGPVTAIRIHARLDNSGPHLGRKSEN